MADSLQKKRSSKSYILSIGFIVLCAVVLIIYLFASGDVHLLPGAFVWPRSAWLLLAAVLMIASWLVESGVLHRFARELAHPINFRTSFRATMVVQFFNNITPSSSGGQPMQIWSLWRDGMPVGESTTIQLGKYLVYQSTLMLCSIIALIVDFGELASNIGGWKWLFIISFLIQVCILAFVVVLIVRPSAMRWLIIRVEKLVSHTPLKAKMAKLFAKVDIELDRFEESAGVFTENPKVFISIFVMTLLQLLLFYSVPFCVCMSLGVHVPLWKTVAAAAFVLMVSGIMPLPGASGGAEGTFALVFGMLFPEGTSVAVAIFLWRLLAFYFPVIAGAPFCMSAGTRPQDMKATEESVNRSQSKHDSPDSMDDASFHTSGPAASRPAASRPAAAEPAYTAEAMHDERPLAGINPQTGYRYSQPSDDGSPDVGKPDTGRSDAKQPGIGQHDAARSKTRHPEADRQASRRTASAADRKTPKRTGSREGDHARHGGNTHRGSGTKTPTRRPHRR